MIKAAVQYALGAYKRWISPMLPPSCRYVPSCSEYAMEAVERHGALYGSALGLWRILRCHPFVKGGYDPVPLHGPKFFHQICRHEHKLTVGD